MSDPAFHLDDKAGLAVDQPLAERASIVESKSEMNPGAEPPIAGYFRIDTAGWNEGSNAKRHACALTQGRANGSSCQAIMNGYVRAGEIEAAELMESAANWTSNYAKALLAATKQQDLAKPDRPKRIAGMTPEQMARMERETDSLHHDFKQIENSYGDDILHLVIASGYLGKLVANTEIELFLRQRYPEFLDEFRSIIAATSLDQTGSAA